MRSGRCSCRGSSLRPVTGRGQLEPLRVRSTAGVNACDASGPPRDCGGPTWMSERAVGPMTLDGGGSDLTRSVRRKTCQRQAQDAVVPDIHDPGGTRRQHEVASAPEVWAWSQREIDCIL